MNSEINIRWHCLPFQSLSLDQLHDLIELRVNVFVVEQNCPYPELDGKDKDSFHLMGFDENDRLIAYMRIVPAGIFYKEVSLGRVVTEKTIRGQGFGHPLMEKGMETILELFGNVPVRISAQEHLKSYYEAYGFKKTGQMYLEDGIPHIEMLFIQ